MPSPKKPLQEAHRPYRKATVPDRIRTAAGIARDARPSNPALATKLNHRALLYLGLNNPADQKRNILSARSYDKMDTEGHPSTVRQKRTKSPY